jgi:diguanylate cyclase (GGDEF)-like protein
MTTSEQQLSDVLSEFARTMLTDFPIQGILDQLVSRIVEVMPITGAGVTLVPDASRPHYVAASDSSALRFEALQTRLDEGPGIAAYETGDAVVISDLRSDERFGLFASSAVKAGLAAVFTFPLRKGDQRLGALDLYRDTPGPLSHDAMVIAQTLADVTSAYLFNAQTRSDLSDSSAQAVTNSLHDALTGLPNRVLLLERIEYALLCRARSERHVAVLFIDLDGFKRVNDTCGHQTGDELLIAVGDRLARMLRPSDTLARLSGDEFVVVCHELDHERQVEGVAARVVVAIASPFSLADNRVELSASIGIAFAADKDNAEEVLHRADVAMYQVKRKGGGHHQVIDVDEQELTEYHESLQGDLGHAVRRQQLRLEYQPLVHIADGRVNGVEALLRWDHPTRGPISPGVLIPFAERSGDIIEIGRWVLEQACIDRHRWEPDAGSDVFVMSVNASAHQLMAPGFISMVEHVMASTKTRPDQLCLEITESAFVRDAKRAVAVLSQLKDLGIQVALDDFGTGYSSLRYLKEFPIDTIKIDQTFIADLTKDRSSYAIVAKTIELAEMLDLAIVCEGVETREQFRQVQALTSDYCQGFLFSHPMTAENVDQFAGATAGTSPWSISV